MRQRHPSHRPRSRAASRPWSRADEPLAFDELVSEHRAGQVDRVAPAQALERHRLVQRDDGGVLRRRLAVRLYASRHEPLDELVRLAQPDAGGRSATPPARPSTSASPAATGSSRSRRSTRRTCSAPSTGSTSTSRPTARRWARSSTPAARCRCRRPARAAHPRAPSPTRRRPAARAASVPAGVGAVTADELEVGLDAIAAPVRGTGGDVVAALGISGPSDRLGQAGSTTSAELSDHATPSCPLSAASAPST